MISELRDGTAEQVGETQTEAADQAGGHDAQLGKLEALAELRAAEPQEGSDQPSSPEPPSATGDDGNEDGDAPAEPTAVADHAADASGSSVEASGGPDAEFGRLESLAELKSSEPPSATGDDDGDVPASDLGGAGDSSDQPVAAAPEDGRATEGDAPREPHDVRQPQLTNDYSVMPQSAFEPLRGEQDTPVPLFDGQPSRADITQGSIGDCGVLTTLGAVAAYRPDDIEQAIRDVGDGRYEVTLHEVRPATVNDPVARPTGVTTTYLLDDEIPVNLERGNGDLTGVRADTCAWPALLEKAAAAQDREWDAAKQVWWDHEWIFDLRPEVDETRAEKKLPPSPFETPTGYDRLHLGTTAYERADLLAELTGLDAVVRPVPGEAEGDQAVLDEFRDLIADEKPVLVGSRAKRGDGELAPPELPVDVFSFGHAYEVTEVVGDKLRLHNPWGVDRAPELMDVQTFREYYVGLYTTLA